MNYIPNVDPKQRDGKIFGLDKTIFYVIAGAAAVLILMVGIVIYLRIKRHRTHREAKIRARTVDANNKQAQGIAFQPSGEGCREEIDLKVFDNEAVSLDEEIKLQD